MLPRIAVTAGEPAGIGPEIVARLAQNELDADLVAICDPELLRAAARSAGVPLVIVPYDAIRRPRHVPGTLRTIALALRAPCVPGTLDARNGAWVIDTLARASDGCLAHEFDALVTAPVHKAAINDAGIAFTGHTEFLARRAKCDVVMMLATPELRVALATTHLPLRDVPDAITPALLRRTLAVLVRGLRERFALRAPRIAVLGLNPHAGESGHMGREEIDVIVPVLEDLRAAGIDVRGPLPADTAFVPAQLDQVDAVLALYHDQGLPVLKARGFGDAVNVTLGLPYLRTSVDHGTALDLAGTGKADASSLLAATRLAVAHARP